MSKNVTNHQRVEIAREDSQREKLKLGEIELHSNGFHRWRLIILVSCYGYALPVVLIDSASIILFVCCHIYFY